MIDIEIVRALSQRDNFVKYKRFIKQEALSREAFEILDWYGEWFKLHSQQAKAKIYLRFG